MIKEIIKVTDNLGFIHQTEIQFKPESGIAFALNGDIIIGDVEHGKLREPMSDNDKEWEEYDERLNEWKDEVLVNLIPKCEEYFNRIMSRK